jgi:N-acetylmuramoyl-L-alanine amidase
MSNEEEDRLLQTEAYQAKLVEGLVRGIQKYFEENKE